MGGARTPGGAARSLHRLAALVAMVAGAAAVACPPAAAAETAPGSTPYGLVAVNGNFVPGKTVAERTAAYRRLYEAGVRAIRLDINWFELEPTGPPLHDYDFSARDREIEAIHAAGLKVIGILAYGHPDYSSLAGAAHQTPVGQQGLPPFQLGSSRAYPPDHPEDFARFARDVARHYVRHFPGTVIAWEIWNEENEGYRFWFPREDPGAYARLLCASYPVLKRVDARATVVFGGLFFPAVAGQPGLSAPEFLQRAYDSSPRLGRCFDAMGYHPYPYPFTAPELEVPIRGSVLSAAGQMRAVLRRNGDAAKPVWITEVGWPTHDRSYGVPEAKQAQYVVRMQAATFAQRVPLLTWYTYGDYADPSGANQEAWFGLFHADGTPKPAFLALRRFARVFRGTRFFRDRSRALRLPGGAEFTGGRGFALEYRRRRVAITALWLAGESAEQGQGSPPAGTAEDQPSLRVRVRLRGRCATVSGFLDRRWRRRCPRKGAVVVRIGEGPLYLRERLPARTRTRGM